MCFTHGSPVATRELYMDTLSFMAMETSGVEDEKNIIHRDCPYFVRRGQMAGVLEQQNTEAMLPGLISV